jgi:hypothetical protein
MDKAPTDFSQSSALTYFGANRRVHDGNEWPSGHLDVVFTALYNDRSVPSSLTLDLEERYFDGTVDPAISEPASSLSQDTLDKIVGVGSYSLDGLIDYFDSIKHGTLWSYSRVSVDPSADQVRISGDQTTLLYYTKDSNGSWVEETKDRFEVGAELRLIDVSDAGVYTIASSSYDSDADETVIAVNEDLTDTDAGGYLVGATFIPNYT